jgi:hypothetical protein
MPDRIPPPPFWRTRHYAEEVVNRSDRFDIDPADILAAIQTADRRVVQPDGRIRYWRWIAVRGRWLRVVTLADGITVHTAFWDRRFRP